MSGAHGTGSCVLPALRVSCLCLIDQANRMYNDDVTARRIIAQFLSYSIPVEEYLKRGGPLTDLQLESIILTVDSLQTFLDTWKMKHGKKD